MKSNKCPNCGLVIGASWRTCKRCGRSLEPLKPPEVQPVLRDARLAESIKTRKGVIYGVGFMGTLAISITAAVMTEDTSRMAVLFAGITLVGFISSWLLASLMESRMLAGREAFVYPVTRGQKISVLTSSLITAFLVFPTDYGIIISPLIVVLFNGALFLYERQIKAKQVRSS